MELGIIYSMSNNWEMGLFDKKYAVSHLSEMDNPIESIDRIVNFEMFCAILDTGRRCSSGNSPA